MNGQKLSELLTDIDSDLVTDAMPPDWRAGKVKKVKKPKREHHFFRTLGDIMDSGWAAAILSVLVAGAVLTGIVMAGRMAAGDQGPAGDNKQDAPYQPGAQIDASTERGEGWGAKDEPPESSLLSPVLPDTDITIGIPDEIPFDAPVAMHMNGTLYTDHFFALYDGYLVSDWREYHNPADGDGYDATGDGAAYHLPELAETLKENGCAIASACKSLTFTARYAHMTVTSVSAYDLSCKLIRSFSGFQLDRTDLDILRAESTDGVFLVVEVETNDLNDKFQSRKIEEYPVYIFFPTWDGLPMFDPLPFEEFPSNTVVFDRETVRKVLDSDFDPDRADDIEAFVELYAPDVSPDDAARMVKLMRGLPAPFIWQSQALPDRATYEVGSQKLIYTFTEHNLIAGASYEFILYANGSHANDCAAMLPLLEEPVKVFSYTNLIAVTEQSGSLREMWLDMKGVLTCVRVSTDIVNISTLENKEILSEFEVWRNNDDVSDGDETTSPLDPETQGPVEVGNGIPEFGFALSEDGKSYTLVDVVYTYNPEVSPLNEIAIPTKVNGLPVTAIANGVFRNIKVAYVTVPALMTDIGSAFTGCTTLEGIYFEAAASMWESVTKADDWRVRTCLEWVECADATIYLDDIDMDD